MGKKLIYIIAQHEKWIVLASFVAAVLFPLIFNTPYFITVAINCLMYIILTLSLNLLTGYLGISSLGHAAFLGIGAYTAAILSTRLGIGFLGTVFFAIVLSGIFGFLLGAPTLRINGRYLVIVTMGFVEIARIVELNWTSLTRGALGILNIPSPTILGVEFKTQTQLYYIGLILVIITIAVVTNLIDSKMGRAITSIRGDEIASGAMGINTSSIKLMTFTISSMLAGVAGAYYAHYMSYIDSKRFSSDQSVQILSMVILGGLGSVPGSIIGAIVLVVVPELLRDLGSLRQVFYGVVIVIMVLARPKGLLGGINFKHIRQRNAVEKAEEVGANE